MQIIRKHAFARAGLIGNPSDGYYGKTISIIIRNFQAEAVLYEWEDVEVVWSQDARSRFRSVNELVRDVELHGYYSGIRLVKATIKKFVEFCHEQGHRLHDCNFSVRYQSNIPRQVGMAGSSAIIVATLRCLMEFYEVEIPREVLPSLALAVETRELGIAAGLQDRVIQVYEGIVYMDFAREVMHPVCGYECGVYEPLTPTKLPPIYVAYSANVGEPTEVVHNDLRARYNQKEPAVVEAMQQFAELARAGRAALLDGDHDKLGRLIDANFDLRRKICKIASGQLAMVEQARSVGASAKFAGSGGAIIGLYQDEATFERLCKALEPACHVIRPMIGESSSAETSFPSRKTGKPTPPSPSGRGSG